MPLGLVQNVAADAPIAVPGAPARVLQLSIRFGLASRLALVLSVVALVMAALVQLPAIGQQRSSWLDDRVATAMGIVSLLDEPGDVSPYIGGRRLLDRVGLRAVDLRGMAMSPGRVIFPKLPDASTQVDLRKANLADHVIAALSLLAKPQSGPIRIIDAGPAGPTGYDAIEVVVDEAGLRKRLLEGAAQILAISATLAGIVGGAAYLLLRHFVAHPLDRLSRSVNAFADNPLRAEPVIVRSERTDEIGAAEQVVSAMQADLGAELRHKQRLAALGLSVCKINHELRNQLATAQLIGDRLEGASEPVIRQLKPRLVATIDRAVRYCEATLSYGRAAEQLPVRRLTPIAPLLDDLLVLAGLSRGSRVSIDVSAGPALLVDADPEQLERALTNLVRNAVQALDATPAIPTPEVRISANRKGPIGSGDVSILVSDNGPGITLRPGAGLFAPFQGNARPGGSGLGLAIADELVRLHGGTLRLERSNVGACFRIVIPDRPGCA